MKDSLNNQMESLSKIAEVKRILALMQQSNHQGSAGCYVITSGEPQEGKTTLCAGLAIAAAEQNNGRVLVIDFNWHNPSLHKCFNVDPAHDASDLDTRKPIEDMVRHTWLNNLDVLPALVRKDPGIEAETVRGWPLDILRKTRESYDYVFVDTSSIYPTNQRMMDPILISKEAHGVVLVALTNVTPKQTLKRASMAMKMQGAPLIGVVANQWKNPMI